MAESNEIEKELQDAYQNLSKEAQRLIGKILEIEKEKLHMGKPHGVYKEILNAIDEVIE